MFTSEKSLKSMRAGEYIGSLNKLVHQSYFFCLVKGRGAQGWLGETV